MHRRRLQTCFLHDRDSLQNDPVLHTDAVPMQRLHMQAGECEVHACAGVAANFALVGLGTDTGNSVRGPAAHAALVGMRPTLGLTSRRAPC
jgi:hypothetical protein